MTELIRKAEALGFDTAVPFSPSVLKARQDVRDMCKSDKCMLYGRNWGCPPYCGTVEECQEKMHSYSRGILLQTVGHMVKAIDSRCYRETEQRHLQNFYTLAEFVRTKYPQSLCLGAGGCRLCAKCAYPDPCRFPERVISSMEGFGLFVTQVCRDTGTSYYHGERTITYTACILF